jgi:hypothetical protein
MHNKFRLLHGHVVNERTHYGDAVTSRPFLFVLTMAVKLTRVGVARPAARSGLALKAIRLNVKEKSWT